jgi:hypothetical protein
MCVAGQKLNELRDHAAPFQDSHNVWRARPSLGSETHRVLSPTLPVASLSAALFRGQGFSQLPAQQGSRGTRRSNSLPFFSQIAHHNLPSTIRGCAPCSTVVASRARDLLFSSLLLGADFARLVPCRDRMALQPKRSNCGAHAPSLETEAILRSSTDAGIESIPKRKIQDPESHAERAARRRAWRARGSARPRCNAQMEATRSDHQVGRKALLRRKGKAARGVTPRRF